MAEYIYVGNVNIILYLNQSAECRLYWKNKIGRKWSGLCERIKQCAKLLRVTVKEVENLIYFK